MKPIAFHGLIAYTGNKSLAGLWRSAKCCETEVEICVSDRAIGPVGVCVQGSIRKAFEQDCCSEIGVDGKRYATRNVEVMAEEVNDHDEWIDLVCDDYHAMPYPEGWMSAELIRAVWVKSWANENHKRHARLMAKKFGVDLLVVDTKAVNRIWDHFPKSQLIKWEEYA